MNKEYKLDLDSLIEDPVFSLKEAMQLHHRIERKMLRRFKKYLNPDFNEQNVSFVFILDHNTRLYEECKNIIKNNWEERAIKRALKNTVVKKRNRL